MSADLKINFKVDGVIKRFQKMLSLSGDLSPVLMQIRGQPRDTRTFTVIGGIQAQFISQGAFLGDPWKPLSTKPFTAFWERPVKRYPGGYQQWKAQHYPGKTMLIRSGKLFNSLTMPGADYNVEVLTPTKLSFGTALPYAHWHFTGTKRNKMPKRKPLGFTDGQKDSWKTLIRAFLEQRTVAVT